MQAKTGNAHLDLWGWGGGGGGFSIASSRNTVIVRTCVNRLNFPRLFNWMARPHPSQKKKNKKKQCQYPPPPLFPQ